MREISFGRWYTAFNLVFFMCIAILVLFLAVYFAYWLTMVNGVLYILLGLSLIGIFLWTAKSAFTDFLSFVRFNGLRIRPLDDALILNIDSKEYRIPIGEDVDVIYCMMGWLIIWPSEDTYDMILLRKELFPKSFQVLGEYFKAKMNYVSAKDEKKKLLESRKINVLKPWKYIRWPVSHLDSNKEA